MTSYIIVSFIFTILSIGTYIVAAPSLVIGTIQFSKDSILVPLNINCGGAQIPTSLHSMIGSKVTFEIPKAADLYHFDVLITQAAVKFEPKKYPDGTAVINTVDYLKIDPQDDYLLYELDFIDNQWVIKEKRVPESGKISDKTIIIECYPEWVQDFKGGSVVELPTLFLDNALVDVNQTEEELLDAVIKLELNAFDSKIMNAPMNRRTLTLADQKRIIIIDSMV